jgi:N-methylhydantoinase B/oxoprolinase/acetone carboxylase alpha subunit
VRFTFYRPQTHRPAHGMAGGGDGATGSIRVDGEHLGTGVMTLSPGSRAVLETPCGAGYGDPRERARAAIEEDLRQGYVTPQHVRDAYGLVPVENGRARPSVSATPAPR